MEKNALKTCFLCPRLFFYQCDLKLSLQLHFWSKFACLEQWVQNGKLFPFLEVQKSTGPCYGLGKIEPRSGLLPLIYLYNPIQHTPNSVNVCFFLSENLRPARFTDICLSLKPESAVWFFVRPPLSSFLNLILYHFSFIIYSRWNSFYVLLSLLSSHLGQAHVRFKACNSLIAPRGCEELHWADVNLKPSGIRENWFWFRGGTRQFSPKRATRLLESLQFWICLSVAFYFSRRIIPLSGCIARTANSFILPRNQPHWKAVCKKGEFFPGFCSHGKFSGACHFTPEQFFNTGLQRHRKCNISSVGIQFE